MQNSANICSAQIIDKNMNKRQCKNKCKNDRYCHIHLKNKIEKVATVQPQPIQLPPTQPIIQFLDDNFKHNLMDMYNSWSEIDSNEIVLMDNEYWPVTIIINHFTFQLNNSNMENPYPTFPNCPFNRVNFTVSALLNLKSKLSLLKKPINIALKLFLIQSEETLQNLYSDVDNNSLTDLLKNNLRYMLINTKNSQDLYTGFWVSLSMKYTTFERLYIFLNSMPYQIILNGYIMENINRNIIQTKMETCITNYDMFDNKFCVRI